MPLPYSSTGHGKDPKNQEEIPRDVEKQTKDCAIPVHLQRFHEICLVGLDLCQVIGSDLLFASAVLFYAIPIEFHVCFLLNNFGRHYRINFVLLILHVIQILLFHEIYNAHHSKNEEAVHITEYRVPM